MAVLLWFNQMGGRTFDYVADLDLDDQENLYATGRYSDTADFDPSSGQTFIILCT